jgi:O-antigen ligase
MSDQKVKSNNLEFIILLLSFLLILFFSSTYFMSYWWAHAVICILACLFLKKASRYSITWILIANAFLFSNQTRFSIEFVLIAIGLSAWALSDQYLRTTKNQKIILVASLITISVIFTLIGKSLNEKYAFLAWLPILVSFYFPIKNKLFQKDNLIASIIPMIIASFSSKKSIILGFFAQYIAAVRSIKSFLILIFSASVIFLVSFLYQDNIKDFYGKSMSPRLIVWQSAANGFSHKPLGGNGFGIFPIEINNYRESVHNIGGNLNKHLNHAHNNFLHIAFEQGVIGLALFALLSLFLFRYHPSCFWTLTVLSMLDASLVYSAQYLIASLIFLPSILKKEALFDQRYFVLHTKYQKFAYKLILFISLVTFGFSVIGHYFYDIKKYDMAIKFDSDHSLYQFFSGIENFKENKLEEAVFHFEKSINLSKNHGFQQGFLAVTYYSLGKGEKSIKWISESLRLAGDKAQWKYIAHFLYKNVNPELSEKLKFEAINENPLLAYYEKGILPPKLSSIGGPEGSNFWINSYQRRGEKVYLPNPQF